MKEKVAVAGPRCSLEEMTIYLLKLAYPIKD